MLPFDIENLRYYSRKMVRELGILEIDKDSDKATPQHWHALIEIAQNPQITISKLSQNLVLHLSTVSRLINSLLEDKLIQYTYGIDRREKSLKITPKGQSELKKIDEFSHQKIINAFKFLTGNEQKQIFSAIKKYSLALEKSREEQQLQKIKILTISTSRFLRKQIKNMVQNIQKNEFSIPVTDETNACIMRAEEDFHYNNSYNFWYAIDEAGSIIGCIALKKIDKTNGEIKKFFVVKEYRGQKVSQVLMNKLLQAAKNHGFKHLYLGTVDVLKGAQKFYLKCGFIEIAKKSLPKNFQLCALDTVFFKGITHNLRNN